MAKLPMMLITPKISPFLDRIVRYDPSALPGTGAAAEAAVSNSCILEGLPIFSLVAYTEKTKVCARGQKHYRYRCMAHTRMMAKRTVVCVLWHKNLEICWQRTKTSNILVTQQCGTHTANYHVDSDAKWNEETSL